MRKTENAKPVIALRIIKNYNEPIMNLPILEYDPQRTAVIEPSQVNPQRDVPEYCVICFFKEVIEKICLEHHARVIVENRWEDGSHPLYEISHAGNRLAFYHPGVGSALSAALLEEVISFGCRKFIACGGCGVLEKDMPVGTLVVVTAAVRDEGVSYHYLPPAREVAADRGAVAVLEKTLSQNGIPYRLAKTWTTDAPYRETRLKITRRRSEGCLVVEMEAAALMAVAEFRDVLLGQMLYAGDDLSGAEWDNRGWQQRSEIRERLFWLAAEACVGL
jgi:uridine phosphorylase